MSRTAAAGKSLLLYCAQRWPPSMETQRPNSGAQEKKTRRHGVFLDHMSIAAYTARQQA